jgi:toxin ParE1/3/4
MPLPKRRLALSQRAKEDLREIFAHTLLTWGEAQLAKYRSRIDEALRAILRNPSVGRPSVKPNLKVLPAERHRIYYRTVGHTTYIVRILHERMDTSRHL